MVGLLGEKFTFLTPMGQPKFPGVSHFLFIFNDVLLINFLNYAFTSSIREVIKFYNLGDKTFETDFRKNQFLLLRSLKFGKK